MEFLIGAVIGVGVLFGTGAAVVPNGGLMDAVKWNKNHHHHVVVVPDDNFEGPLDNIVDDPK